MTTNTSTISRHAVGSAADLALDVATRGRTGKSRKGFHLAIYTKRGVTASGTPSAMPDGQARCTCDIAGNHGATR